MPNHRELLSLSRECPLRLKPGVGENDGKKDDAGSFQAGRMVMVYLLSFYN